jgi:hypothetical protein
MRYTDTKIRKKSRLTTKILLLRKAVLKASTKAKASQIERTTFPTLRKNVKAGLRISQKHLHPLLKK